jgi:hypothetical protein
MGTQLPRPWLRYWKSELQTLASGTQRATQKAFWPPGAAGTEDISIEKIEVLLQKQELKANEEVGWR